MIQIGFFSDIDTCYSDFPTSISYPRGLAHDHLDFRCIRSYIKNAPVLYDDQSELFDSRGSYIGRQIVQTNGEFVWPAYLLEYYSRDKRMILPEEFIESALKDGGDHKYAYLFFSDEMKKDWYQKFISWRWDQFVANCQQDSIS
jgi:hypothetical protein